MSSSVHLRNPSTYPFRHDSNYFDSSQFHICCGCHVRKCSSIIGLLEIISLVASVLSTAMAYFLLAWRNSTDQSWNIPPFDHHASLSFLGATGSLLIGIVVIGMLFCGVAKEKPSLLVPHMIIQFLAIIGLLATTIVFAYIAAVSAEDKVSQMIRNGRMNQSNTYNHSDHHDKPHWTDLGPERMFVYSIVISSLCLIASGLEMYFLVAVYRTYAYFCAKRDELKKRLAPVKLWSTGGYYGSAEDLPNPGRLWSGF